MTVVALHPDPVAHGQVLAITRTVLPPTHGACTAMFDGRRWIVTARLTDPAATRADKDGWVEKIGARLAEVRATGLLTGDIAVIAR